MVAGIPVPSLLVVILLGLANNDSLIRWNAWFAKQLFDPDVATTAYCTYNNLSPSDVYLELFDRLHRHFENQPILLFNHCNVVDVRIGFFEDANINVTYFVKYRYP